MARRLMGLKGLRPHLAFTLGILVFLGASHPARAGDPPAGDAPAPAPPPAENRAGDPVEPEREPVEPKHKDKASQHEHEHEQPDLKKKKKKKKKKKLAFGGRVFARSSAIKRDDAPDLIGQTTLESARAGADYRSHDLRAQLEVELANKAKIKDAYVQLRLGDAPKLDVRAGNFKMPFSAIQMESIWTLPMADRGLVDNVLAKRLQVAGRAVGAMVQLDAGGPLHPGLRAGVFQGTDDAGNLLEAPGRDAFGQNGVVRISMRPADGIEIGASGQARAGALIEVPLAIRRAYAADLDVTVDVPVGPGQLRAWLEGMIGTSWLVGGMIPGHELTRFLEARGIVAYRLGGADRWDRYVELYALAGAVNPDRVITGDRVVELSGGITYGARDVWRVQLEGEVWRFGDNAPLGIAEFAALSKSSLTVLVQIGARL